MRTGRRQFLYAFLSLAAAATVSSGGEKKPAANNNGPRYAIVGGTVFQESGFAFRGAEVTLEPEQSKVNGVKLKAQKAVSDGRGEFAFRVPPVEAKYKLTAVSAGRISETKPAATRGGEERIDVTFTLLPASK